MKGIGFVKVWILLALSILSTWIFLGCAQPVTTESPISGGETPTATSTQPVQKIMWRANSITNTFLVPAWDQFFGQAVRDVFEKSGGRLEIQVHWNNELGFSHRDWPKLLKEGLVEMSDMPMSVGDSYIPAVSYEQVPMNLGPPPDLNRIVDVIKGRRALYTKELESNWNAKVLNVVYVPPRTAAPSEFSATKPLRGIADLKGIVMRNSSPVNAEFWANFGVKSVIISMPEIYMAYKTGMIDAATLGRDNYKAYKFYEVAKYLVVYYPGRASFTTWGWSASKPYWNKLPPDLQKIVADAYKGMQERVDAISNGNFKTEEDQWVEQTIKDYKIEIITFSAEDTTKIVSLADQQMAAWLAKADELGRALFKSDMTGLGRPERYDQLLELGKTLTGK